MASLYKFFHSLEKAEKQSWAFLEELLLQNIIKMILWFKPAQAQDINIYCPKEKTDVKAILLCHEANWYSVTLISINKLLLIEKNEASWQGPPITTYWNLIFHSNFGRSWHTEIKTHSENIYKMTNQSGLCFHSFWSSPGYKDDIDLKVVELWKI